MSWKVTNLETMIELAAGATMVVADQYRRIARDILTSR